MKRFEDPTQTIRLAVGETFALALAGNPTTGYTWQVDMDGKYLELLERQYEPGGEAIGAGGLEVFHVRALAPGNTEIVFEYKRSWDAKGRDTKNFQLAII